MGRGRLSRSESAEDGWVHVSDETSRWKAPELYEGKACSNSSDLFDVGTVLWELASSEERPYSDRNLRGDELQAALARGELPAPALPGDIPVPFQH